MNKKFLNLGLQPLANKYLTKKEKFSNFKEDFYRLEVCFNTKNKLVSLYKKINVKKMFNNNYPYKSSLSLTMLKSFKELSTMIKKKFKPKLFLEIGSNDGALVQNFNKNKVICVEPCSNLAKITKKKGYLTFDKYWNFKLAKKIKSKFKTVNIIYSANTLTHIENLNDVFKSITHILSKNGVLIIEDPSLLECLKKISYDQFYNEHIYLFSAIAVKNIINKFKLEIFDIQVLDTHGGYLRYFIKRTSNKSILINKSVKKQIKKEINFGLNNFSTYKKFAQKVKKSRNKLNNILKKVKKNKNIIIGYGATAKATTILNYCGIDNDTIDFFLDTTPGKVNKFMPGKNIKILPYNKKIIDRTNYMFLGAWNFKKEIFIKESKFISNGGKFITHVPIPKII